MTAMALEFRPDQPGFPGDRFFFEGRVITHVQLFTDSLRVGTPTLPFHPYLFQHRMVIAVDVVVVDEGIVLFPASTGGRLDTTYRHQLYFATFMATGVAGTLNRLGVDYVGRFYPSELHGLRRLFH
jgi:hypothetical protein